MPEETVKAQNLETHTLEMLEIVGVERAAAIWRWLVDPEGSPEPLDLKKEELVAVYYRNLTLLEHLREVVASLEKLQGDIANRPQLNKGPMRI